MYKVLCAHLAERAGGRAGGRHCGIAARWSDRHRRRKGEEELEEEEEEVVARDILVSN